MKEKVVVLMGGISSERNISLQSGQAVMNALNRMPNIEAVAVDVADSFIDVLQDKNIAKVFVALHGKGGEDGSMQGLLELLNLSYTGSKVMASALAMDKLRTKYVWMGCGLPTPAFQLMDDQTDWQKTINQLKHPLIVKPSKEGSSIGMTKVTSAAELKEAYFVAKQYDDCVIAEQWIDGEEYTVPILNGETLPIICLKVAENFYDYHAKYESNDTAYLIPSGLTEEKEQTMNTLALAAFDALGCEGWGRLDFMIDREGNPWLLEANTIPGLTDHSLVPMSAAAAGLDFDVLISRILETATK